MYTGRGRAGGAGWLSAGASARSSRGGSPVLFLQQQGFQFLGLTNQLLDVLLLLMQLQARAVHRALQAVDALPACRLAVIMVIQPAEQHGDDESDNCRPNGEAVHLAAHPVGSLYQLLDGMQLLVGFLLCVFADELLQGGSPALYVFVRIFYVDGPFVGRFLLLVLAPPACRLRFRLEKGIVSGQEQGLVIRMFPDYLAVFFFYRAVDVQVLPSFRQQFFQTLCFRPRALLQGGYGLSEQRSQLRLHFLAPVHIGQKHILKQLQVVEQGGVVRRLYGKVFVATIRVDDGVGPVVVVFVPVIQAFHSVVHGMYDVVFAVQQEIGGRVVVCVLVAHQAVVAGFYAFQP